MKKIALVNQKGGVGKTTTAINIGAGLTRLKKKVLLIDLDPQAHLTYSLGIKAHELDKPVYELLTDYRYRNLTEEGGYKGGME